jgi:hypothetical protein
MLSGTSTANAGEFRMLWPTRNHLLYLITTLMSLVGGCMGAAEPASSPAEADKAQVTARLRTINGVRRFVTPEGSPLNVTSNGFMLDGMMIARCLINEEGNVEQCKVIENPFASKNEDFIAVLQAQKFAPVVFEGKPQRIDFTFRIQFKTDDYFNDVLKICRVHEITGKSPQLGLQAVSQWLLDNIKTKEARKRLAALPDADIPVWLRDFRRDAKMIGIAPCPFTDHWEEFLKRPPADEPTPRVREPIQARQLPQYLLSTVASAD